MNQQAIDMSELKDLGQKFKRYINLLWLIPLLVLVLDSWFTVDQDEVGVVKRFGQYTRTVNPGLNFKIPFRVETVHKVAVKRQLKEEFGFRTIKAGVRSQYSTRDYTGESLMLTGDLSIGNVEWIVQYKVKDPIQYLFKVRDVTHTLRNISEAVIREVVGDRSINEVLTTGRHEIASAAHTEIQNLCDRYETGILISHVVLQDVNPPDPVKPSFNEVNQAQQEKENMINQAWAQYNKVIPAAAGQALQKIQEAEGYALKRVNEAKGDVARFEQILAEYRKAPAITKKRLYLETMQEILPGLGQIVIVDEQARSVLPLLNLGKEVTK